MRHSKDQLELHSPLPVVRACDVMFSRRVAMSEPSEFSTDLGTLKNILLHELERFRTEMDREKKDSGQVGVSVHETAPVEGLIAIETMTLVPAATPDAGTVTERVVPVLVLDAVPIVLIKAISAEASDPENTDKEIKSVRRNPCRRLFSRCALQIAVR
jgi:hypothetical protein